MDKRRFDDFESNVEEFIASETGASDTPASKLERRRRIEALHEKRLLIQELEEI